jgi:adenylyltransferase/sulfurtransferase
LGKTHDDVTLSREEIIRYARHLNLPEVALGGQKKLKAARVLLIGAGGLGSPLGMYLAAAGVGYLGLIDYDVVEASNLQRQVIYATADVGRRKLEAARERLHGINPHIELVTYEARLSSENALDLFRDYDIIVDGSDNFPTRYLVNDACALLGKPNVYGSIFRFEGQATVFDVRRGPCYRCLYPTPPPPGLVPNCADGGVLGALAGLVGTIQATETIKLILGQGETLLGRLLLIDALKLRFRELALRKDPECPLCGANPTITELIDYEGFCGLSKDRAATVDGALEMAPRELKARLDRGETIQLLDVREPQEWEISHLPGARLIPLGELPSRLHELTNSDPIVVYCRTGQRSTQALNLLQTAGYQRIEHLKGGIDAWAREVDPTVLTY